MSVNSSNMLLKLLGKVLVRSDDIQTSSFKKVKHTIGDDGSEEILVSFRFRRRGASPVTPSKRPTSQSKGRMFDQLIKQKLAKLGK